MKGVTESQLAKAVIEVIKERFPELYEQIRKMYPSHDMPGAIGVFAHRKLSERIDINGKVVKEGDRIRIFDEDGNEDYGVVEYNRLEKMLVLAWPQHRSFRYLPDLDDDSEKIEIINHE